MTLVSELRDALLAIDRVIQKCDRGEGLPGSLIVIRDVVSPWVDTGEAKSIALKNAVESFSRVPKTADGFSILFGMNLHAIIRMNDEPPAYCIVPCGFVEMNEDGGTVRDEHGNEYEADYFRCYVSQDRATHALKLFGSNRPDCTRCGAYMSWGTDLDPACPFCCEGGADETH